MHEDKLNINPTVDSSPSHLVSFFFHKYIHTYICMYVCICIHTYRLYYKSCVRCMSSVGTAARRANRARSARGDFAMQSVASHNGTAARSVNRARSARGDFWRHLCAV
jgi:hypothetical protein